VDFYMGIDLGHYEPKPFSVEKGNLSWPWRCMGPQLKILWVVWCSRAQSGDGAAAQHGLSRRATAGPHI
jgi:hypothetical protein